MKIDQSNKNTDIKNNKERKINNTLQGVLVNSHLRLPVHDKVSFDDIQDSLLINQSNKYYSAEITNYDNNVMESAFDAKKAMAPLLAGTTVIAGGCFALSCCLKKSSNSILKSKNFERLPDLAINMNIREEPQFAIYRAIRDPNFSNIMGAVGVFLMSGITIACKNFIDGAKEIWVKKRNADTEKNLQENLISVDRDTFSGKLKVVNDMMNDNIQYFENIINSKSDNNSDIAIFRQNKTDNKPFRVSFKNENSINNTDDDKQKNLKYTAFVAGIVLLGALLGKFSYSNLKNTMKNARDFADKYSENTINAIENISSNQNRNDIPRIVELMKSVCAKPEYIKNVAKKYNLSETETQEIINAVEESKKTIFADAPTALGGIPKKVQYYCYIDEPRGHLYNWILNPENKFTKYIFQAFTFSSAFGYTFKQGMDAIKEAAVFQENAKTELDLKKRLVSVEIASFKAKKESAVNPLIDNFTKAANEDKKSKKELKQLADNILMEIKNGPPYVYN